MLCSPTFGSPWPSLWPTSGEHWPPTLLVAAQLSEPNQQRTLNKLPPELRRRNFADKHRLSVASRCQTCRNVYATCTYSDWASILHATTVGGWEVVALATHPPWPTGWEAPLCSICAFAYAKERNTPLIVLIPLFSVLSQPIFFLLLFFFYLPSFFSVFCCAGGNLILFIHTTFIRTHVLANMAFMKCRWFFFWSCWKILQLLIGYTSNKSCCLSLPPSLSLSLPHIFLFRICLYTAPPTTHKPISHK